MRIYIEYEVPTASGSKCLKAVYTHTLEEAEDYCKTIEKLGYKLKVVNNEP